MEAPPTVRLVASSADARPRPVPTLDEALEEIDNPAARALLCQLWAAIPEIMRPGYRSPGESEFAEQRARELAGERQLTDYQRVLREDLERSGLLGLYACGQGCLPDIQDVLRQPLDRLFQVVRPRNQQQLLRHFLASLNWYVWPAKGLPLQQQLELLLGPLLILGTVIVLLASASLGAGGVSGWFYYGLVPAMLIYMGGLRILLGGLERRWIHARALYEYVYFGLSERRPGRAARRDDGSELPSLELDSDPEALARRLRPQGNSSNWPPTGWV